MFFKYRSGPKKIPVSLKLLVPCRQLIIVYKNTLSVKINIITIFTGTKYYVFIKIDWFLFLYTIETQACWLLNRVYHYNR